MRRAVRVVVVGVLAAGGLMAGPASPGAAAPQQCTTIDLDADWQPTEVPWSLQRLQPERAWPITRGEGVTVAVVDSGIDVSNPHLQGQVSGGQDFASPAGSPTEDCVGHGTGVAGVIAGKQVDDIPFYGVAPGATLMSLRQTSAQGGSTTSMAEAIRYAADNGADVVNVSVTSPANDPNLQAAVQYAAANDVVVVAAAGNDNIQTGQAQNCQVCFPAAYESVLAVSAVEPKDVEADVSHQGYYVDVAAPGSDIVTTFPVRPAAYRVGQGTSFAAPYVAGVAALVRAHHPDLSAERVIERIIVTADPPVQGEENVHTGAGVVNPYAAVSRVMPTERVATPPPDQAVLPDVPGPPDHTVRNVVIASVGLGTVTVVFVAAMAAALPRGRRRRWQPGRWQPPAEEEPEET